MTRSKSALLGVGLLVALLAGGVAGYLIGDDSSEVDRLESDLDQALQQRDEETERSSELASQLRESDREIQQLEQAGSKESPGAAKPKTPSPGGLLEIGEPGESGQMTITPTSFTQITTGTDTKTYQAVISVKNNGSEGIDPFCGDEGSLVDEQGRTYEPDTDLDYNSSNCGDSVQPGLTISDFRLKFDVPLDSKPVVLKLWGDYGNEGNAVLFNVKGI